MHRYAFSSSVIALLLGAFASVAAQAAGATTMPLPILGIGGGVSIPAGGVAKDRVPGFNLTGLAEFRTPSEPLGLRAEVLYQYFGAKESVTGIESSNSVAALINVVYHAPQSQVRPYLIGGMGLYHVSDRGSRNSAGFSFGTGVSIPLTNMGAFAEVRVHGALSQGPSFVTIPVTFGITF